MAENKPLDLPTAGVSALLCPVCAGAFRLECVIVFQPAPTKSREQTLTTRCEGAQSVARMRPTSDVALPGAHGGAKLRFRCDVCGWIALLEIGQEAAGATLVWRCARDVRE
jgi:hypothetical protein